MITMLTFVTALIVDVALIFHSVFHLITFDDMKSDLKNPIDLCKVLNPLILPEYGAHIFINLLFLVAGEWIHFVINIPLMAYHIKRYQNRPISSRPGIYDATSVMNGHVLKLCIQEGQIKLGFYILCFFFYMAGLIMDII